MKSLLASRFTLLKRQTLNHSRKAFVTSLVSFLVPFSLLASKGPSVPTGVSASAVSCSQVTVTWQPSTTSRTMKGYNIYRGGTLLNTVGASATSYSDTSVASGTSYSYTVSGIDSSGESPQSSPATVTTPSCGPTVPGNVRASAASCNQINISWSASTDSSATVTRYNVYRNGALLTTVSAPSTSFSDTSVVASTTYNYTVSATDSAGNTSAQSSVASATTPTCPDTTPPTVPGNVVASAVSCTSVSVSWSASTDSGSGVHQYNVYRNGTLISIVAAPAISFVDTTVVASSSYTYTVSATDVAGNTSAQSAGAPVSTPACGDNIPPTVPTGVTATAASCNQVNVSWNASTDTGSGVKQYNIYRNNTLVATVASSPTSYLDATVSASTSYNYTVSATDNAGNTSAQSAGASVTPPPCGPTVPGNVSATAVSCSQNNVSWSASTDAGSTIKQYNVYRLGAVIATVLAPNTSYSDTTVVASTLYSYKVSATDNAGEVSATSTPASATTPSCGTGSFIPTGVTATVVSCGQINLSWNASTDAYGIKQYNIYRNGVELAFSVAAPATSFSDTSVSASTFYSYTVSATDNSGSTSAQSAAGSATTPVCGGGCTVTVTANASTGGSASGGGTVNCGSSVTVNATANSCDQFVNWTVNGAVVSTSASYTFAPSASETIIANFAPVPYTISTSASPASSGTVSGGGTVNCGSSVTVVASAASGYVFTNWTENGVVIGTPVSYTFTASANRNLVANFVAATCTDVITTSASAGGTASGGGSVSCGSSVTVNAAPSSCYHFVNWTVNGASVSTSASYTFLANANETLTANFALTSYTVTTSPSTGGTASGGGTVNCGSSVTVTATANACYQFVNWTVNGAVVSTSTTYNFVPTTSETLTANFAQISYTVTTISSPSAGGTASGGGTVTCGNSVNVSASPNSGYTFSSWTVNGSVVSTSSSYTFTPSASESLMANFTAAACTYALSSSNASYTSSGGTGSVTVTAGSTCSWNATSSATWITITSGSSGTGNGTVSYSVAANTSSSTLTGTITIAGKTFTVTEAAAPISSGPWAESFGGVSSDAGQAVTVDSGGNIILAGYFMDTIDFGNGTGALTSAGGSDVFIAKFTAAGVPVWAKRFGSSGNEYVTCIALDASGNIFIGGYFNGTTDLGTGPITSSYGNDAFVAKYSPVGVPIWVKTFGGGGTGMGSDQVNSLAVDKNGNVVVTGYFEGNYINFGTGMLWNGLDGFDSFLVEFSGTGTCVWARVFACDSDNQGNGVTIDSNGDIIVVGQHLGGVDLSNDTGSLPYPYTSTTLPTQGSTDIYIGKFGPDGTYLWSKSFGGPQSDAAVGVAVDSGNNIFVTGYFTTSMNLGAIGTLTTSGTVDPFVAKFSTSGVAIWARSLPGGHYEVPSGIAVDSQGNVAINGIFDYTINLGGGTVTTTLYQYTTFIAKYSGSATGLNPANYLWGQVLSGTSFNQSYGITTDSNGYVIPTGYFTGSATIENVTLNSVGASDIFLLRLSP